MHAAPKSVSELPAEARGALESLVGQPLDEQEYVFIVVCAPDAPAFRARRDEARRKLQETLRTFHSAVSASGVTAAAIERTIDEACDEVRYDTK
jgi:hypothetical protein